MNINLSKKIQVYKNDIEGQLNLLVEISTEFKKFKSIHFSLRDCVQFDLENLNLNQVIYLIEVKSFGRAEDGERFCKIIQSIKNKKSTKFKLPKVNSENCRSSYMYICKSTGSFKTRLEQHFKSTSASTYALHLCRWNNFEELAGMEFILHYSYIDSDKFNIRTRQVQKDLLEMVETSLHKVYKPLLGRYGH